VKQKVAATLNDMEVLDNMEMLAACAKDAIHHNTGKLMKALETCRIVDNDTLKIPPPKVRLLSMYDIYLKKVK
jgi:hypothetical protein